MTTKNVIQEFEKIIVKGIPFHEITLRRTKRLMSSAQFENKHSKLPKSLETIKKRFIDDIFYYWKQEKKCRRLSPREWVKNLTNNLEELGELLGAETLQLILPDRVFTIEEEIAFYSCEQWMLQSVKKMRDEIATITELWIELHFEPKTKWTEIIAQYKEVFHLKLKENHSLHFCHVISSIKEFTIATKKLYDLNKVGYGNLRDYLWNKEVIAGRDCSAILKDCIGAADSILRLENTAFKIVSKHFSKKSREELNNLVKQSSILNFFDLENGLVAIFERNDQGVFLKMVFDINKREFAKWVALKIQLDPRHLLMKLRQMEIACAKYLNPRPANYYRFPSINKCKKCKLEKKDCWCPKPFTEEDIHPIVLRYLADSPFFKTDSSGVTHLIKHYFEWTGSGELYLDRLEMLRGYRLEDHIAKYISLIKQLVSPEPKTGSSLAWLERHKKDFKYNFGVSDSICVKSVRKSGNDGVFVYLTIKESGEISIKTLY